MSDYIVITREMLALGLRGSKLLVYALVYGFCKDGDSDFHGSSVYVAEWCGISKPQALAILRELTEDGLLLRDDSTGTPRYSTVGGRKTDRSENRPPRSENRPPSDILSDNTNDKTNIAHTLRAREDADLIAYGDHVRMTAAEHDKLVARFGAQDTDRLCEILDGYLDNPKRTNRYRSHYRAILGWVVTRLQEEKLTQQRMENAKQQAQRAQGIQQAPSGFGRGAADAKRRLEAIQAKYDTPAK